MDQNQPLCAVCNQPKTPVAGEVGGFGFGNVRRPGTIYVCLNKDCPVGEIEDRSRK